MATRTTTHSRVDHSGERTVKFGDVTVTGKAPSAELVRQNVQRSTEALERLAEALATPGVRLRPRKGIPLFWCDSNDPDVMIRTLDGKTERGRIVDGVFRPIA